VTDGRTDGHNCYIYIARQSLSVLTRDKNRAAGFSNVAHRLYEGKLVVIRIRVWIPDQFSSQLRNTDFLDMCYSIYFLFLLVRLTGQTVVISNWLDSCRYWSIIRQFSSAFRPSTAWEYILVLTTEYVQIFIRPPVQRWCQMLTTWYVDRRLTAGVVICCKQIATLGTCCSQSSSVHADDAKVTGAVLVALSDP